MSIRHASNAATDSYLSYTIDYLNGMFRYPPNDFRESIKAPCTPDCPRYINLDVSLPIANAEYNIVNMPIYVPAEIITNLKSAILRCDLNGMKEAVAWLGNEWREFYMRNQQLCMSPITRVQLVRFLDERGVDGWNDKFWEWLSDLYPYLTTVYDFGHIYNLACNHKWPTEMEWNNGHVFPCPLGLDYFEHNKFQCACKFMNPQIYVVEEEVIGVKECECVVLPSTMVDMDESTHVHYVEEEEIIVSSDDDLTDDECSCPSREFLKNDFIKLCEKLDCNNVDKEHFTQVAWGLICKFSKKNSFSRTEFLAKAPPCVLNKAILNKFHDLFTFYHPVMPFVDVPSVKKSLKPIASITKPGKFRPEKHMPKQRNHKFTQDHRPISFYRNLHRIHPKHSCKLIDLTPQMQNFLQTILIRKTNCIHSKEIIKRESFKMSDASELFASININELPSSDKSYGSFTRFENTRLPISFDYNILFDTKITNFRNAVTSYKSRKDLSSMEYWHFNWGRMSYENTILFLDSMFIDNIQKGRNSRDAFDHMRRRLLIRDNVFDERVWCLKRPFRDSLNADGVLWWCINIIRRGLYDGYPSFLAASTPEICASDLTRNYTRLLNECPLSDKLKLLKGNIFQAVVRDERNKINMQKILANQNRIVFNKPQYNLTYQYIVGTAWMRYIEHYKIGQFPLFLEEHVLEPTGDPTNPFEDVSDEEPSADVKMGVFNKTWNNITKKYDNIVEKISGSTVGKIAKPLEEMKDSMISMLGKMDGYINSMLTTVRDWISKVFGKITGVMPTVVTILELIYAYLIWNNSDNIVLRISAFTAVLHALNMYTPFMNALKFVMENLVDDEIEATGDGEESFFSTMFTWLDSDNSKYLSYMVAIIIIMFGGYQALNGNKLRNFISPSIGEKVIEGAKNWHWIGAGLFGCERIFKYCVSIFKISFEWLAKNVFSIKTREDMTDEEFKELSKEITKWGIAIDYYSTSEGVAKVRKSKVHHTKVTQLITSGFKYNALAVTTETFNRKINMYIQQQYKKMLELHNLLYRSSVSTGFRHTPFHIQLYGKAGIGKSTLMQNLISKIADTYYPEADVKNIIFSPKESVAEGDDWDGYCGQEIIYVDEMWKILSPEIITQWIGYISCAPVMLPMAWLNEKIQFFTSEFILSNTNVPYPSVDKIASSEAVWRRRHIFAEPVIDEDVFNKSSGKFDLKMFEKKYPGQEPNDYPHLRFNLLKPVPEGPATGPVYYQEGEELPNGMIVPTCDLTFAEFCDRVIMRRDAMLAEENRAFKRGEQLDVVADLDCTMLDILDKLPRDKEYNSVREWIKMNTSTPGVPEEAALEKECSANDQSDMNEVDELFESKEVPKIEPKVNKVSEVKVMVVDGTVYYIGDGLSIRTDEGPIVWNKILINSLKLTYPSIKIPVDLEGKSGVGIQPTGVIDDQIAMYEKEGQYARANLLRKKAGMTFEDSISITGEVSFDEYFGMESVRHVFNNNRPMHSKSVFKPPVDSSDPPMPLAISYNMIFNPIAIGNYCEEYSNKYGAYGSETVDVLFNKEIKSETIIPWQLTEKEKQLDLWVNYRSKDIKMSWYYLSRIRKDGNQYYYDFDWKDTAFCLELSRNMSDKTIVLPTALTAYEPFMHTINLFLSLPIKNRDYILKNRNMYRRIKNTFSSIRSIAKTTTNFIWDQVKLFFSNPFKFTWSLLKGFQKTIISILVTVGIIEALKGIGRLFLPKVEPTSKAYHRPQRTPIPRLIETAAVDDLEGVIQKNLFVIKCNGITANGFGLEGHLFTMSQHLLPPQWQSETYIDIQYCRTLNSPDLWDCRIPVDKIYAPENSDIAFVNCQLISPFRKLTQHIRTEADNEKHPITSVSLCAIVKHNITISDFKLEAVYASKSFPADGRSRKFNDVIHYDGSPKLGSSGGVLYTINNYCPRNIIGIQCYRYAGKGIGLKLTKESIDIAISKVGTGILHSGPYQCEETLTPTADLISEHLVVSGSIPSQRVLGQAFKSDFVKTPLSPFLPPSTRIPAILRPDDGRVMKGDHPLKHSVNKFGRDIVKHLDDDLLRHTEDQIILKRLMKINKFDMKILTFEECLQGLFSSGNNAINVKTSPGIPYVYTRTKSGKLDLIEFDEFGNVLYYHPRLLNDFNYFDKCIRNGIIPPASMYEFPKDELRPISKALGPPIKTRSISVCPLVLNLLYRKYNLAYDAALQRLALGDQEFCVGINPDSLAWTVMHSCMEKISDQGFDLDVGNWDGHMTMQLKNSSVRIRNEVYKTKINRGDLHEKDCVARRTLAEFSIFGSTQFEDLVLQKCRGQPSGWAGTASENTECHEVLSDYIIYQLAIDKSGFVPDKNFIERNVCKRIYGDDIFYVIRSDQLHWLNGDTIGFMYSELGWPTTSAHAKSEGISNVPISQISFLKRTFKRYKHGTFLSALDLTVVDDMLVWMRDSANPDQLYINLRLAMRYVFPHGRKVFDLYLTRINQILQEINYPLLTTTYYEINRYYDTVLFENE